MVPKFVKHVENPRIAHFGFSLFYGAVWCIIVGVTVLTTRVLLDGGDGRNVVLSPAVFFYIPDALQGKYAGHEILNVVVPWVIVATYLISASVKGLIQKGIVNESSATICHCIIGFDTYANWHYMSYYPWYYQFLVVIIVFWVLTQWGKAAMKNFFIALNMTKGDQDE